MVLGIISRAAAVVKGRYRLIRRTKSKKRLADLVSDDELFGTTVWLEAVLMKRGKKANTSYLLRNVVLTTEYVSYGNTHGGAVLDKIQFWDMAGVVWNSMNEQDWEYSFRQEDEFTRERKEAQKVASSLEDMDFAICTTNKGYFRGRPFIFRTSSEHEREVWASSVARVFSANKSKPTSELSTFEIWRRKARWMYLGDRCQIFVACLIFLNFVLNIAESQFLPEKGTSLERTMSAMNLTFTFLFTLELVVNMFATLVVEFLGDAWNWFDSVVVLVSLISVFLDSLPGVSVLRLLRAFRVFRLFKRIPSLRQILVAINQSVPPMLNAFALVTLLTSIYAIMAVTFFKEFWPELFGDFVTSSFTMFQIMTGDQWGDIARELFVLTDNGPAVAVFFVSYQLLVALVLVNVVIAVLLEEFAKAAAAEKETGSKAGLMEKGGGSGAFAERCPLERLVVCLQNFADSEDFEMKIHVMFLRLTHSAGLVDGGADVSTRLDSPTFRSGMAKYGMVPPIYFTPDDWERLVVQEGLAGEDGRIGYVEFGILVRQAFRRNQLREMTHVMESEPTQWTRAAVQVAMMSVKSVLLEGSYGAADIYSLPLVEGEESRHVSRHDETQDGLLSRISSAAPAASMRSLVEQVGEEVNALQRRMGDMEVAVLGRELGQESARGRSHSLGDNDNGGGKQDEFKFSNLLSIFTPQKQANGNPPPTDPAIARRRSDPEEERLSARGQANAAKGNGWNLFGGVMPFLDQAKPPPPMQSAESSPAVTPPMSPVEPVEISSWRPARVR